MYGLFGSRFAVGTFKKEASRAFKLLLLLNNIVAIVCSSSQAQDSWSLKRDQDSSKKIHDVSQEEERGKGASWKILEVTIFLRVTQVLILVAAWEISLFVTFRQMEIVRKVRQRKGFLRLEIGLKNVENDHKRHLLQDTIHQRELLTSCLQRKIR